MKNRIEFLVILFICMICLVFSDFCYPSVRRDDTISDDYFGTKVKDPYRWLENPDSNETKKFVTEENAITRKYIDNYKYRDRISERKLYDYPRYEIPVNVGSKYYYSANTGLQNQNIYYSIDSIDSNKSEVFLDPNQLSSDGTTSVDHTFFSNDGKFCAYAISKGGSDWVTIKIKNTETLDDLPETLTKIKFPTISWTNDSLGFFYAQYDEYKGTGSGTEPEAPKNEKLFYHKINANQKNDIKILGFPDHPFWGIGDIQVSDDSKYVHIFPQDGMTNSWYFAKIESLPVQNLLDFTPIVNDFNSELYYVSNKDNLVYVQTNRNAPNFRLIRVDLNDPQESNWIDILPENDESVLKEEVVVFNNDYLAVVYMRDVVDVIQIHSLIDGKFIRKVDTPIGTVVSISATKKNETTLFYKITSFLQPGTIYRYDFSTNNIDIFRDSKVKDLDINEFETNQVFYKSKDKSVMVPMFLVHRKNIKLDGSIPTLLYGYGGFNINIQPSYKPLTIFFIKNMNGVYASANIRGGGEYGESWHRAGMRTNKQNVFDDFASAAEYLISNNYTRKDRLTIQGGSNGGLLIGASANQRPDLFGCGVAQVGVMDMIRFPFFTGGIHWIDDYGDPQHNKTEFDYIYRYSPLHSIPKNVTQYPAMLVLTADHDDRVVPAHSYKFAAQLQYLLGSKLRKTPLMIRIDVNAGHGAGRPVTKLIQENTDIVSFVLNSLKIDYQNIENNTNLNNLRYLLEQFIELIMRLIQFIKQIMVEQFGGSLTLN